MLPFLVRTVRWATRLRAGDKLFNLFPIRAFELLPWILPFLVEWPATNFFSLMAFLLPWSPFFFQPPFSQKI